MGSAEKITDRELKELERKVSSVYRDAAADVSRICNEYWTTGSPEQPSYQQRLQEMHDRLAAGEITKDYYRQWVRNNIGRGERWNTLRDEISRRAATANQVAATYINDTTPGIYSLNANRTAYAIEQTEVGAGLDFVLINEQAVRNLVMGNNQYEFRTVRPDRKRDYAWNSEKIERQLTLGILAGDSVKHMTDRFMSVMGSNRKAAIRNARTAITSAQNAGSLHTMQAARDKGIDCQKEWLATTGDNLTRDSHLLMNGIRAAIDDDFPIGLAYPGDPKGDPAEVYNCRCTMITIFPGINDMKTDDDGNEISYEEWLADKMERGLMPPTRESDEDTAGDTVDDEQEITVQSVEDCRDIDDLRTYFADEYGAHIADSVNDLNYDIVKGALSGVERVFTDFDGVSKYLTRIDTTNDSCTLEVSARGHLLLNNATFHATDPESIYSFVNTYMRLNPDSTRYIRNESIYSDGVHESAHLLELAMIHESRGFLDIDDWRLCSFAKQVVDPQLRAAKKMPEYAGMKVAEIRRTISEYANTNASECMAEAFADVYANGENARTISRMIYDSAKDKWDKIKGKR